jgi:hypothetical protein
MILQNPAIDVDPYKFHGVADIYQAYGKWIARTWPRPPNHPRTPAQLANWNRFQRMISIRSQFAPLYLEQWKSITTPPQRSYDDIWRSGVLKTLNDPACIAYESNSSNISQVDVGTYPSSPQPQRWWANFNFQQYFPCINEPLA